MRRLTLLAAAILAPMLAHSEPVLKIVNFTAEWCPNCQILNPAMNNALTEFPAGQVEMINLDMTHARSGSDLYQKNAVYADAIRTADSHQAGYLWDWYGGVTGLAVIISADNGEPISCMNRILNEAQIADRLREATIISQRRTPGTRMPNGPDCPPPLR